MTRTEAQDAETLHTKVWAGKGEDYDTGYIEDIGDDPKTGVTLARVAWDSGVTTYHPISDLEACR